jgi:parvulin-like peptidyl-prolyl isomerase
MTKRQLSRHEREVRRQRIAIVSVAVALAVALLLPIYGYWRENIAKGGEPVALVRGQPISTEQYARFLGYQNQLIQRDAKRLTDSLAAATDETAKQSIELQLQLLQQSASTIQDDSLQYLIDRPFILEEATARGLTATPEDLDRALREEMSSYSLGGLRYQTLGAEPDDKLLSLEQARADLKTMLGQGQFLTEDEVRDLALTQRVLRSKIQAAVAEGVPTTGEQVHARHILVEDEEAAKAARERIVNGEDFAAVAKEVSTDTSNKDEGGDLGWFTRDQMVSEFADAAFSLPVGEISQPVKSSFGYHIIKVEEKAADRPFEQTYLDQQRAGKFQDWLAEKQSAEGAVEKLDSQDKQTWAEKYVVDRMPTGQ